MIVVLAMTAIILLGAFGAYAQAFAYDSRAREARERAAAGQSTEEQIRNWISRAGLSTVTTDTDSYMISGDADAGAAGAAGAATGALSGGTDESTLTFTASGGRLPSSFAASNAVLDDSNDRYGPLNVPRGGVAEVSFSLTGIAEGAGKTGLFLRVQRPADGDPSQGGYQELLDPDVDSISYEFWNGLSWDAAWNTQAQSEPRLPAAVRVTYHRKGEADDRVLTVTIPASDVTADNPVVTGGAQ